MALSFLIPTYDARLVLLSMTVAMFASFVALDLARHVHTADGATARYWLAGGSFAMGTGIWSMHFVAMLAFSLPVQLGYDITMTLLSWFAAVIVSWIALSVASRSKVSWQHIGMAGMAMGVGICVMHYIGMFAMQMDPGIDWDIVWLAISVVIAVVASFASLLIFFWMRNRKNHSRLAWQGAAAIIMAFAISGMHYSGMEAARFPLGSICRAASALDYTWIALLIGGATISMLIVTLVTSTLDARLQSRTAVLASSLKEANTALQRIAFLDGLTDLPNRMLLTDRLEHAIARSRRSGQVIALLFVDLDGFKTVNDSLGHQAGDQVLKEIAKRLSNIIRASETVARIGGDEFVVLVEAVDDRAALAVLARRIEAAVSMPIVLENDEVQLSASIGIAVFPDDAKDEKQLLAHADLAMYNAKASGKNTHRFHDAATTVSAAGLMADLRDLRYALERREFELFYQPKLAPNGTDMLGVEALIRWRHPTRGLVLPNDFIPIAERFGLIVQIGSWVIEEACRQMRAWLDRGWTIPVAVNLSVQQLRQPDLVEKITESLVRYGIKPQHLTLELTESGVMDDAEQTLELLNRLEALGVKIAIDDFGTGYSSLSYLRRFCVNELKIDGSFVRDVAHNDDARSIVAAMVNMAHSLNLRVVAEGVETLQQSEFLSSMKCDELQGYFFSRPLPVNELEHRLTAKEFEMRVATGLPQVLESAESCPCDALLKDGLEAVK
ncbi:MAG: bifunctional diguanylate cyclase/phosphodiesterase [Herminiimonas sp.]|nr:bifunctional diguanylate cyclase/phosphodiesterase [Herminiimonas sp.]